VNSARNILDFVKTVSSEEFVGKNAAILPLGVISANI
jgi:hypothetical protein